MISGYKMKFFIERLLLSTKLRNGPTCWKSTQTKSEWKDRPSRVCCQSCPLLYCRPLGGDREQLMCPKHENSLIFALLLYLFTIPMISSITLNTLRIKTSIFSLTSCENHHPLRLYFPCIWFSKWFCISKLRNWSKLCLSDMKCFLSLRTLWVGLCLK